MRPIEFSCSCGRRLTAVLLPPATPHSRARIEFHTLPRPGVPAEKIRECPNCQKSFAGVSAETFLAECGSNW
jgi:hypothetical protein